MGDSGPWQSLLAPVSPGTPSQGLLSFSRCPPLSSFSDPLPPTLPSLTSVVNSLLACACVRQGLDFRLRTSFLKDTLFKRNKSKMMTAGGRNLHIISEFLVGRTEE